MREWSLGPGDPLFLTLAADYRTSRPDYTDDQIWELAPGRGDPPAVALCTTYGLRARSMRIFPRFLVDRQTFVDPASFASPPCLRRFSPNSLEISFSPLAQLDVRAEYWIPDSHVVTGRLTVSNRGRDRFSFILELCAQLTPLDGQSFAPVIMQSTNVLAGRSSNLAPVIFLTGGPLIGPGPYPALMLDLALDPGETRTFTWVHAALADPVDSFELARRHAAAAWDAEHARIELLNAAQTVGIQTGDPDWDAAFAFTQKAALGLFLGPLGDLPEPSFVLTRQPGYGFSMRGDGLDHHLHWSGGSPLEAYYLASLLPGSQRLAAGMLKNFLAVQTPDGSIDLRPGQVGQRAHRLAAPFLTALAWNTWRRTGDLAFAGEVFPGLLALHHQWFTPAHDRDRDGFPEWEHAAQAGLDEDLPDSDWQVNFGSAMAFVESPALAALLYRDGVLLAKLAALLGNDRAAQDLQQEAKVLGAAVESCWQAEKVFYHYRDRDTHLSPAAEPILRQRGDRERDLRVFFGKPTRLLVQIHPRGKKTPDPEIIIEGRQDQRIHSEHLTKSMFTWNADLGTAVSQEAYTELSRLVVRGLGGNDQVTLQSVDFGVEDISLMLPLWAGIPDLPRAQAVVHQTIFAPGRFGRPYGAPTWIPGSVDGSGAQTGAQAVHMPWNHLLGEALLTYGMRSEAAQLTACLMNAVVGTLKSQNSFFRAYHVSSGAGLGERNTLHGLAPLGLFLQTLGVEILSPRRVFLTGKNPFPWPVTVQYRGLTVIRRADETQVTFPDGQTLTLIDPVDAVVSVV